MMLSYLLGQGCGNSFVLFDFLDQEIFLDESVLTSIRTILYQEKVDSALLLMPSNILAAYPIIRMLVYESDGSFSQFCGNGARVVGTYLHQKNNVKIIGLVCHDGIRTVHMLSEHESVVHMLQPNFDITSTKNINHTAMQAAIVQEKLSCVSLIDGISAYFVEVGEPHLVILSKLSDDALLELGIYLNTKAQDRFPYGINLNVIEKVDCHTIHVRTFERGVQRITKSCGSGSISSAIISQICGLVQDSIIRIHTYGGSMYCYINANEVYMIGSASITKKE